MNNLAVDGRRSAASVVEAHIHEDGGYGEGERKAVATIRRIMHLNKPLGEGQKLHNKRTSWWNVSAQETRAEGITAIEQMLGRQLTYSEWQRLSVMHDNFADGIDTQVSVWLDKES